MSHMYALIKKALSHSVTIFRPSVIPLSPPLPILMAVCSPNWPLETEFQLPCLCRHTNVPDTRSAFAAAEMSYLTLTLTSDHINNARNELLRSDLYEKMVLRMNLALLLKKL